MKSEGYYMEKLNIDEIENVAGGNDSTTRTIKFGDMEFKVEEQQGLTEDDMKGADAKPTRGAQSLVKNKMR